MIIDTNTIHTVMMNTGGLEIKVHTDYVGRSMYGRKCLAIEWRRNLGDAYMFMFELAAELARVDADGEEVCEDVIRDWLSQLLDNPSRQDNLGNNGMEYWPNIQIED